MCPIQVTCMCIWMSVPFCLTKAVLFWLKKSCVMKPSTLSFDVKVKLYTTHIMANMVLFYFAFGVKLKYCTAHIRTSFGYLKT